MYLHDEELFAEVGNFLLGPPVCGFSNQGRIWLFILAWFVSFVVTVRGSDACLAADCILFPGFLSFALCFDTSLFFCSLDSSRSFIDLGLVGEEHSHQDDVCRKDAQHEE